MAQSSTDDPRLDAIGFGKLKQFLAATKQLDRDELFDCGNKTELVSLAAAKGIKLDPLLDEVGSQNACEPGVSPPRGSPPPLHLVTAPIENYSPETTFANSLVAGKVFKEGADEERKRLAEQKAKAEVERRAAKKEARRQAGGGVDEVIHKYYEKRKLAD